MEPETVTHPVSQDPFGAPAVIPTTYPSCQSFHGRLVLIRPTKIEQVRNQQDPSKMDDRITADVTVVDGLGPVPLYRMRQQTGQVLEGPDFPGTYFNQSRIIKQLTPSIGSGMVLARIGLYKEGQPQGQGNPWGLVDPTEEDKQTARNFLATRTIGAVAAPAAAPVAPNQAHQAAQAYVAAQPQAPAANFPTGHAVPQPQPAYAQQQAAPPATQPQMFTQPQAPAAPVPGANPFA